MEYWIILLFIIMGAVIFNYLFKNFNIFKRHGVIHVPRISILGSIGLSTFRRTSFNNILLHLYNFNSDAKYVGFYVFTQPAILLCDPELIKDVIIKNFNAFSNRSGFDDVNDILLSKNIFFLKNPRWRYIRMLLSRAFTTSKMKTMFTLMSDCAIDYVQFLSDMPVGKSVMNMKDVFMKFTNDVIVTCVFGIKVDSMRNPTNEFYIYGKHVVTYFSGFRSVKIAICTNLPKLGRILGLKPMNDYIERFFKNIVKTIIIDRDTNNITRPDIIQLMMDMRGKHEADKELDIDDMTAQAFSFFFGGFDTSSSAMSFIAHEIAVNPEVQAKLRQEIDKVLENSNGALTYEMISRLEYLDAVINESLRLYSPPFVERICEKAYELPPALPGEKSFTIQKGQIVWIPIYAIHHDEKYYIDPEKFCPERFLNNHVHHNSSYYMPFGLGPRMCIGYRFALLLIKVLMAHLLARCELKPCAKTTLQMEFNEKHVLLSPKGGFWLNVQRRRDMHPTIGSAMPGSDVTNS